MTDNAKPTNKAVDIFADFAVNEALSQDGVWVPYRDGVEFLIARAGNKNFRKVAQHLYKKNARILDRNDEAAADKLTEIIIEAMAKGILLNWKGSPVFGGEALPYSMDNARKILGHERFKDWVEAQSKDEEQYAAVQEEEDGENLPK